MATKMAADRSAENATLRSELEETKAQIEKLREAGDSSASKSTDNAKQKMQHLEKVKRELAQIKDAKSQQLSSYKASIKQYHLIFGLHDLALHVLYILRVSCSIELATHRAFSIIASPQSYQIITVQI